MALKGCSACLKYVVLFFNLLFWLAGIGILALAIWLRVDYARFAHAHPDLQGYYTGTYILMAAGSVMSVVGFFGCCGAYRESPCMLGTFFVLLLFIFVAEIGAGVWAYMNKGDVKDIVKNALVYTVKEQYQSDPVQREAIDLMQRELKCCGANGYKDWSSSKYGMITNDAMKSGSLLPEIGVIAGSVASAVGVYKVPESCCVDEQSKLCSDTVRSLSFTFSLPNTIHKRGCADALEEHLTDILDIVAIVGISIAAIELLGMILSLVLCCAIFRKETYKP